MTTVQLTDFGLGFASLFLLIQVTGLVYILAKKYDAVLGLAGGMMMLDLVALITWMAIFKVYADNEELFVGGMGLAIFSAMIHKVKKFHKLQEER